MPTQTPPPTLDCQLCFHLHTFPFCNVLITFFLLISQSQKLKLCSDCYGTEINADCKVTSKRHAVNHAV